MTSVPESFGLYVILTNPVSGYENCAEAAVCEGIRFLQLRMKDAPRDQRVRVGRAIRELTRGTVTNFIVNDDVELAQELDADGVHLGQTDMPLSDARARWTQPGKIFGWSTHNEAQIHTANRLGPDYIGIGPIFPTPVKNPPDPSIGCKELSRLLSLAKMPAVAIGGITLQNLPDVLKAGAKNFAVVRAICEAENPRAVMRQFMAIWREFTAK